jgi:hypothetical protein
MMELNLHEILNVFLVRLLLLLLLTLIVLLHGTVSIVDNLLLLLPSFLVHRSLLF